ncbi:PTS fructose-like transporter subunit IIB [Larsenimonas salina]|uniref:PTS fructose-like transporter subunit IIB n=1 Tax=Larsenimonas salina TaxID=1295565 RepID=UPI002073A0A2|nr:PTS fructose-like transporter subunit IIB [Larsenimonas salina]MCM5705396.1 PTS fructose-like transporter subunit IIB [Larsenimonas salina]
MKAIIITACPSGMATTFLAARRLELAAVRRGWEVVVDNQSDLGKSQTASDDQLREADLVVVAAGRAIDLSRFDGKRLYQGAIDDALPNPDAFLAMAEEKADTYTASAASTEGTKPPAESSDSVASAKGAKTIVAVTACPTGVAHTFMAAEALSEAGRNLGHSIRVETQGSVGAQDQLTASEIEQADVVILACDIEVDVERFQGKPIYRTSTGSALKKSKQTIEAALAEARVEAAGEASQGSGGGKSAKERGVYKHLLTGVSFMLPMVVAGGLCIALSFVFGIEAFKEEGTLAAALMQIGGGSAFKLMVPVLAGYIAYSIADRPGIAPGMIGGWLASSLGAGFIGGILAGFLAGYAAKAITRYVKLPASVESLKPILIIPLLASLFTGLVMIYAIGTPVAAIMSALTDFLKSMGTANAILLGLLLGGMMCVDMGGPVNKAAYTFGVGLLSSETYGPMAAIMAAGMVPAIGMGIASMLAKKKFAQAEQEAGKASFVLGLCFISEGAIPFAAKDPLRVIPICIIGGAVTGALSMFFQIGLMAPHGGLFVLLIPNAVNHALLYLLSITVGSVIVGGLYALIKPGQVSSDALEGAKAS